MALLDTFVQVFEFDTRQADDAFNQVSKSTDDIIAEMKKAQQSATMGADGFTQFIQNLSAQLTELSSNSVDIHVNGDASNASDAIISEIKRITEEAEGNSEDIDNIVQNIIDSLGNVSNEHTEINIDSDTAQAELSAYIEKMKDYLEYAKLLLQSNALSSESNKKLSEGIVLLERNIQRAEQSINDQIATNNSASRETERLTRRNNELAESADEVADNYGKATSSLAGFLGRMAGMVGIGLTVGGIASFIQTTAEEVNTLSQSAEALELPVEDVDAFGKVITSMGGDAQGARDSLMDMSESIGEALQDTSSGKADVFKSLNISLKDMKGESIGAMEGIYRLSDAVQGMSKEEAVFRIKEVGITDNKIVESILKGRKELEELTKKQKENGVVTKELALQSQKYKEVTGGLKTVFSSVMMSIMNSALPALTKVLSWVQTFVKFCQENKNIVVGFFTAVATILLGKYIYAMKLASISTWTTLFPIIAIIAVIALLAAAFAIVYDDIMNFIDGNDSMIGRILEKYPRLKVVILALWETFKKLFEYLKAIVGVVADIVVAGWDLMASGLKAYVKYLLSCISVIAGWGKSFAGVFNTVSDAVVSAFEWMWEQVEKIIGWVNTGLNAVKNGWKSAKEFFGFGGDEAEIKITSDDASNYLSALSAKRNQVASAGIDTSEIDKEIIELKKQLDNGLDASKIIADVEEANKRLMMASHDAMNPITSQAISNQSNVKNESNVSIGEIKVETQATDAQGMASGVKDALQDQLADFNQQNSTGVAK
ncbi:hypothetical protein ETG59_08075 [Proteus mirabilis]|uniref:hypothetical protein n=2 Tax=Proteus TaxID=583 RepID=UPI0019D092FF|nr:hypothetical protein [Proteus mirabilis]MBI6486252.1 hypothetical protein [Proteus mirabilis]MBN7150494.1 hypothetical protein [Proteus mirabilis]MBN7154361.1 hypothetical protein [Proteus mirabilis]MBN7167124.1 hypothetical protein [Proteus mirabilis]MBN7169903.1 hypothetical protein [Proteus mirabilis]